MVGNTNLSRLNARENKDTTHYGTIVGADRAPETRNSELFNPVSVLIEHEFIKIRISCHHVFSASDLAQRTSGLRDAGT